MRNILIREQQHLNMNLFFSVCLKKKNKVSKDRRVVRQLLHDSAFV